MRMNFFCFILFFFFAVLHVSYAGNEVANLKYLQRKYNDEHAIYLSEKEHVIIKTKGNEFEIYSDVNWEILYLSDKARAYGDQNIQFSKFSEIQNIRAFSYMPKNGDPERLKKNESNRFQNRGYL